MEGKSYRVKYNTEVRSTWGARGQFFHVARAGKKVIVNGPIVTAGDRGVAWVPILPRGWIAFDALARERSINVASPWGGVAGMAASVAQCAECGGEGRYEGRHAFAGRHYCGTCWSVWQECAARRRYLDPSSCYDCGAAPASKRVYSRAYCNQCWQAWVDVCSGRDAGCCLSGRAAQGIAARSLVSRGSKISVYDLSIVGLLGSGAFGKVELVQGMCGNTFARKALNKGSIMNKNSKESVMREKQVLLSASSPFIVRLYGCYADSQFLYLLLEPCLGGDLSVIYQRHKLYGDVKHARFYSGSVILALEHLHERRIIHRDVKFKNVLVTNHGRVKLADMGTARVCVDKAFTVVGTPSYFCPEMIARSGHTKAVDWWTLGIFIFRLLVGREPFASQQIPDMFKRIMTGIDAVRFPRHFGNFGGNLIRSLLRTEPMRRLPMLFEGVPRLKGHVWFGDLDWEALNVECGSVGSPVRAKDSQPVGSVKFSP